ncbi:hypothetical protein GCM10007084_06560 [Parabacteroides faecis]|nr:hypothetical protein GCM10007084_06560 [Parabacteroides faecis]
MKGKDMKHLFLGLVWFIYLFFLSSCVDEQLVKPGVKDVQLRFTIVMADEEVMDTRAGENRSGGINSVYVVVVKDEADPGDARILASSEANSVGDNTYRADLKDENLKGKMYVFANIASYLSGQQLGGITTLGELQEALKIKLSTAKVEGKDYIIADPSFPPMVSEPESYDSSDPTTLSFELSPSTAKVTVINNSGNDHYTLLGANMGNAPLEGYVFPNNQQIENIGRASYAGVVSGNTYSPEYMMRGVPKDSKETEPLYLFEAPVKKDDEGVFVIIKGEYDGVPGYHRLNIWKKEAGSSNQQYLPIERNTYYKINIQKISSAGYATAADAMKNPASNRDIQFNIDVTDLNSHDIVSNGEQYLGVSNSTLILYDNIKSGIRRDVEAVNVSYTVPTDGVTAWGEGSVTTSGNGLTFSDGKTTQSLALTETKDKPIKINCSPDLTEGSLIFRIGNLSKVVKVIRRSTLPAVPEEMSFENVTIGNRAMEMKDKVLFGDDSGKYGTDNGNESYESRTGKLYALVSANVGYNNSVSERDGEFYVASSKDDGRTKVMFHQEKLDVYTGLAQIRPYTFVGTFHRWNQKAERIIRIRSFEKDRTKKWTAVVIVGQDFIELDTDKSNDSKISLNPYGWDDPDNPTSYDPEEPLYSTDEAIEANCCFTENQKGKSLVTGTADNIYFRVGLKSTLSSQETAPRYGLIAFIHSGGTHLIYVRQGEEPDYLMRPYDPVTDENSGTVVLSRRPKAVKIQPYNITVKGGAKKVEVVQNGGIYTSYPSMGGYFFQGNSNVAYYPVGTASEVGWSNNSSTGDYSDARNVCPSGYRRPADGVNGNAGYIEGSEMRQSFWLYPQNGVATSDYGNMLRGYIADGYFDRKPIRIPNTQGRSNEGFNIYMSETVNGTTYRIPTMVGDETNIGYAGMLVYNPYNYASIFIPSSGSRSGQTRGGELIGTGGEFNLWSSTMNSNQMWYLATGYYSSKFVFDTYLSIASMEGFSVRCVKE